MVATYNVALDMLADNLRWSETQRGIQIFQARADYLAEHQLSSSPVDEARLSIIQVLSAAEPVFWSARFCDMIEKSFGTLPLSWRMTDPMLFTPTGWIHFEQPIPVAAAHPPGDECMGCEDSVVGIGWRKVPGTVFIDMTAWILPGSSALMNVFPPDWLFEHLTGRTRSRLEHAVAQANLDEEPDTPAREVWRKMFLEAHREVGTLRSGGLPWWLISWRSGQTIQQTLEAYETTQIDAHDKSCPHCSQGYLRLFGTCLNFLSSKVLITTPSKTDRALLRRHPPKPNWGSINVITMRRLERVKHESDEEHGPVDWSCHWLVGAAGGGFWRHQPMKNAQGEWIKEWRWISTYVKGNLDKPFKPPGKRIFNVQR